MGELTDRCLHDADEVDLERNVCAVVCCVAVCACVLAGCVAVCVRVGGDCGEGVGCFVWDVCACNASPAATHTRARNKLDSGGVQPARYR